ncbi:MAG TPA: ankyrin repeat domain-containing protein [Candidatus Ozemobacteraceae bacterium]|nr:ankyrin repeat domain-containing protein [Candidatus Ozemobacteraceae bacterium]
MLDDIIGNVIDGVMRDISGSVGESSDSKPESKAATGKQDEITAGLFHAIETGDVAQVRKLLARSPDLSARHSSGMPLMVYAAGWGKLEIMKHLAVRGCRADVADDRGNTALHLSAVRGYDGIVCWLLRKGVPVDVTNQAGQTPLLWAVDDGHASTVKLLLDNGARPDHRDRDGETPERVARRKGYAEILKYLAEARKMR